MVTFAAKLFRSVLTSDYCSKVYFNYGRFCLGIFAKSLAMVGVFLIISYSQPTHEAHNRLPHFQNH